MNTIAMPSVHYLVILPEIILTVAAVGLLIASSLVPGRLRPSVGTGVTVIASACIVVDCVAQWVDISRHGPSTTMAHVIIEDGFSVVAILVLAVSLGLSALVADGWLHRARLQGVELHVLALASVAGAIMMAQANDLVVIFLGLEIMSIGLYVLAAFDRTSARSGEAALKYFLLGGFSSAIFVYGIALVYGATGTTQLGQLSDFLSRNVLHSQGLLLAGTALLLIGFAFKVAAVPFHAWSPDVYEGSPTPIVGFMAAIVKVGAFAAVLRVLASGLFTQQDGWRPIVFALAILSMLVGAGMAAVQRNVKRMLAYSSISHAGFVLLALWAASSRGTAAALYYLAAYSLLVIGSFAIVTIVSADGHEDLTGYRGLAKRRPLLAAAFAVFLLAQAGVPFTTGFLAKLAVVESAIEHLGAPGVVLGVVAMLSTAISAYFYLRVVVLTYANPSDGAASVPTAPAVSRPTARLTAIGTGILLEDTRDGEVAERSGEYDPTLERVDTPVDLATSIAIALCVVPTIVFGIWAGPLVELTSRATMLFHP